MNDRINALIPRAIEVIDKVDIANSKGEVNSKFKGYIASFGSSIVLSGLLPSISFYTDTSSINGDPTPGQNRNLLLKAITLLLDPNNPSDLMDHVLKKSLNNPATSPKNADVEITMADLDIDQLEILQDDIFDAALALKMALRTFKLVTKNEGS